MQRLNLELPGWRDNRYVSKNVPVHVHGCGGRLLNTISTVSARQMTCNRCNKSWTDEQLEKAIDNGEVFA